MKKSLTTISLVIISFVFLAPQIAMAVWYNPFTWFKKKPVPPPVEHVSVKRTEKEPTEPVVKTAEKKETVSENKPVAKKIVEVPKSPKKEPEKVTIPTPVIPLVINEPKVAPVVLSISNVTIEPKITSVYISWQTNIATESKLLLNGTSYQSKNGVDSLHYVEIKDLSGGRSYTGTITALANNAWANKEVSFSTKEVPPKPVEVAVVLPTITFGFTSPIEGNIVVETTGPASFQMVATPKTDQLMWQNTITVGVKNAKLETLKLRNIGSASNSALNNFRLYINNDLVSSSSAMTPDGYVVFGFSPTTLAVGGNTIKMVGDVVDGISRNFFWSLRSDSDITIVDSETGQKVNPSSSGPFNFPFSAGTQTIQSVD